MHAIFCFITLQVLLSNVFPAVAVVVTIAKAVKNLLKMRERKGRKDNVSVHIRFLLAIAPIRSKRFPDRVSVTGNCAVIVRTSEGQDLIKKEQKEHKTMFQFFSGFT